MAAKLIRISPRLTPKEAEMSILTLEERMRPINSKTFQFYCHWTGDPLILEDLISSYVDWGPFRIKCDADKDASKKHCCCEVHYFGPAGEQSHLMANFWGLMESFPPFQSSAHSYARP